MKVASVPHKALIKNKWYTVNQLDTAQKIIKVEDKDGEHLFDLEEVDIVLETVSHDHKTINSVKEVNR